MPYLAELFLLKSLFGNSSYRHEEVLNHLNRLSANPIRLFGVHQRRKLGR